MTCIAVDFYHGTSDALSINKIILPPLCTGLKREAWRKKFVDQVFFTLSFYSASMFARKACGVYGGSPVVYKIKPIGQYINIVNNEYIADKAKIIEKYCI